MSCNSVTFNPDFATGKIWKEFKSSNYVFNYTTWPYRSGVKWIQSSYFFYVSEKIVFLFQLLARQANSSLEANSDKRFFNVQYRKNLDNLCAPQKDFNLKKKHRIFQHWQIRSKKKDFASNFVWPRVCLQPSSSCAILATLSLPAWDVTALP